MKRIIVFMLAVVMALGLFSGCNGGKKNGKEITVWCEAIGSEAAVMDEFIKYFNSNNDLGMTMKYEMKESLSGDLRVAIQSNTQPDIVIWPRWETVSKSNLLLDLTEKITTDSFDMSVFNSEARKELEIGGKTYGVATDLDAWGLWCNMDILGQAMLPTTWDELKNVTTQFTTGSGTNKIVGLDAYNLRGQFYTFMLTAGGTIANAGNPPTINIDLANKQSKSYKDAESVLTLFDQLHTITGVPTSYDQNEYFISDKVAMKFGPSNYNKTIELLTGQAKNLKFIGNPAMSGTVGSISGILGGYSLAIPKKANLNNSWEVIKWWMQKENLSKYCQLYELLPANSQLWNESFVTSNDVLNSMKAFVPDYKVRPVIKGYSNVEISVIFAAMDELRLKTKTVEQCVNYIKVQGDDAFVLENML